MTHSRHWFDIPTAVAVNDGHAYERPRAPLGLCWLVWFVAAAVLWPSLDATAQTPDGAASFKAGCASCHTDKGDRDTPAIDILRNLSPNAIVRSLNDGVMATQGRTLTPDVRVAIAEWLTGQRVVNHPVTFEKGFCAATPPLTDASIARWNGWGPAITNTRFQPAAAGGLTAADVPKLTLKWAFGMPGETAPRGQPVIVGGRLFTSSQAGAVYALDAASGCAHWIFQPQAGVRSAVSIAPHVFSGGRSGYAVFFVDREGRVYALDADSGKQIWSRRVEDHPGTRGTGAVTYHDGRLYVPMSGVNEAMSGSDPKYGCCTFRGSLTALDAATGAIVWRTFTIPEPQPRGTSSAGVPLWGPAGVGIWNAPTVDVKRGLIYSGTGPGYAGPPQPTINAVVAFDMKTGAIRWTRQFTPGDVWLAGCGRGSNPNCPTPLGPDIDFSASPILTTTAAGREIIVIPQKSGMAYALDPDKNGEVLWSYRAGPGGAVGGVWGGAVGDGQMYVAVGGYFNKETGGLHAIRLDTGERAWFTPPQTPLCGTGQGCSATQSAAVTAIPGAVFSGSADGGLRAYSAKDGAIIWTFDANRPFETVNGVEASGASFDGPGVTVAGGMVYAVSGNAGFVGRPGNVLLAFAVGD